MAGVNIFISSTCYELPQILQDSLQSDLPKEKNIAFIDSCLYKSFQHYVDKDRSIQQALRHLQRWSRPLGLGRLPCNTIG